MSTKIEWTDETWNPVSGCSKVSAGCANCYAERMSKRLAGRCGYPKDNPFQVTLHPEKLDDPLKWKKPRRIFVNSMSDLFHEDVPEKFIAKVFAIMDLARQHTYMVLTKRPERMRGLLTSDDFKFHVGWFQSQAIREFGLPEPSEIGPFPLRNVWLGVSVENQAAADERVPLLLQTPAAVRFISAEPLLGTLEISKYLTRKAPTSYAILSKYYGVIGFDETGSQPEKTKIHGIDWIITGGESGPGARPMHPDWVRGLRYQCHVVGVPFFFKQWGEYCAPSQMTSGAHRVWDHQHGTENCWKDDDPRWRIGKKEAGRFIDGRTWDEFPEVQA